MNENSQIKDKILKEIDECNKVSLDETKEEIFKLIGSAAQVQRELIKQIGEDEFSADSLPPIPQVMCTDIFKSIDIENHRFINYDIFLESLEEELDVDNEQVSEQMYKLPTLLSLKNNKYINKTEFSHLLQAISLIWISKQIFCEENPNFDGDYQIQVEILRNEGFFFMSNNLQTGQIKEISFFDLCTLIIDYVRNYLTKQSERLTLKLYQKLYIWVKFFQGQSEIEKHDQEAQDKLKRKESIRVEGFNDNFMDELDNEMDTMKKRWMEDKMLDKIMGTNLIPQQEEDDFEEDMVFDEQLTININQRESKLKGTSLNSKSLSQRKKLNKENLLAVVDEVDNSMRESRRYSAFTDLFEQLERNHKIVETERCKNQDQQNQGNKQETKRGKASSMKGSIMKRYSLNLEEGSLRFDFYDTNELNQDSQENLFTESLNDPNHPQSKHTLSKVDMQFSSIDKQVSDFNYKSSTKCQVGQMHTSKNYNTMNNDQIKELRESVAGSLNVSRDHEIDEDQTIDQLKALNKDQEQQIRKLEDKFSQLTEENLQMQKYSKAQEDSMNEVKNQLVDAYAEKNEEITKLTTQLNNDQQKKEIELRLIQQQQEKKLIEAQAKLDEESKKLEEQKSQNEELTGNQTKLKLKFDKAFGKLTIMEENESQKIHQPSKEIQCEILPTIEENTEPDNNKFRFTIENEVEKTNVMYVLELYKKLEDEDRENLAAFILQDPDLLPSKNHHRDRTQSMQFNSVDPRDDGIHLESKVNELQEQNDELEGELMEKRKIISGIQENLDQLRQENKDMSKKNKQLNLDVVESKLLFKQQTCVLVQFMKISRKQLTKFKGFIENQKQEVEHQNKKYKYFGRELIIKQEEIIVKKQRQDQRYEEQQRKFYGYAQIRSYNANLMTKQLQQEQEEKLAMQRIQKLKVSFKLLHNDSNVSIFEVKMKQVEFNQLNFCVENKLKLLVSETVYLMGMKIINGIFDSFSQFQIVNNRTEQQKEFKINQEIVKYQYLFVFFNNTQEFFLYLKQFIDGLKLKVVDNNPQLEQNQSIIGEEITDYLKNQFKDNQIKYELKENLSFDKNNQDTSTALKAEMKMFNLLILQKSIIA